MSQLVKKQPKSYPFANYSHLSGWVKKLVCTNLNNILGMGRKYMIILQITLFTRFTQITRLGKTGKGLQSYPFYPRLLSKRVKRVKQMGKVVL
jgi:hypothetical protein